jgi:hypothetical protein
MAMSKLAEQVGRVSRTDIETKLREIRGEVEETGEKAKAPVLAIGVAVVFGLVAGAYLLGRRRAKKTTTLVEVRRV